MTADPISGPGRVVLWGTYDTGKPRLRILRDGLRANGIEVVECHRHVWRGVEDKSSIRGARGWALRLARIAIAYPALIWRYLRLPRHDWVLVGYPPIPDLLVIRPLAALRRARVAADWFLSAYDTVVKDRKQIDARSLLARFLLASERAAVRLAHCAFADTRANARRLERLYGLAPSRLGDVWVGAEAAFHGATAARDGGAGGPLRVLFYGQFIPLHGVPVIIGAARRLRDEPIDWLLIGRGQESERVRRLLAEEPLPRVRQVDWVDYHSLIEHIRAADLCLGIFGDSEKAASVIPNKIFQALAVGAPILTRDSPAARELLQPSAWDACLVPPGDEVALAEAVRRCQAARDAGGLRAPATRRAFDPAAIGRQLCALLAPPASAPVLAP